MLFFSDKLEKNGPKVEKKLRKELRQGAPLPYEAEIQGTTRPTSIGRFLGDLVGDAAFELLGHRGLRPVYTLRFAIPESPGEIRVSIVTDGKMVMLGGILYSMVLDKPVAGSVRLQEESEKLFFKCKFKGEGSVIAKLNANKELIKRVNGFVRDKYRLGEKEIESKRFFSLEPFEHKSLLTISTMPRSKWFGLASTFDASEFLEIARAVAATI
jgi:hypothetical protein